MPTASPLPAAISQSPGLLATLLTTSLTAVALLRPHYAADSQTIADFAWVYLNPAGQRLLTLPEQPAASLLTLSPDAPTSAHRALFAAYVGAIESESGEPQRHRASMQVKDRESDLLVVAQRCDELLLVNFSDPDELPRLAAEMALRESQAREKQALAAADAQRQRFYEVLLALPAQVATYYGPTHVYNFVNAAYQRYFPTQDLPGQPLAEVLPKVGEQGMLALFDRVYQTGEPFYQQEREVWLDFTGQQQPPRQLFLNLCFHPLRNAQGQVDGVLDFSYDVTEQVLARQQVEQLNQELEVRVQQRTQQTLGLQAEVLAAAQRQVEERELFYQVFAQTPAAIAILRGPAHRFDYVNSAYQHFFGDVPLLGRPVAEVIAATGNAQYLALLDEVYQTGQVRQGYEAPVRVAQPLNAMNPGEPFRQAYFNFTYSPYRVGGQVVGLCILAHEVTAQALARQAREAEQQLVSAVFVQAPAGIWVVRAPDYVFEYVNPAMTRILGKSAEQLLGRPYFEALPELAGQGLPALLRQVWEQGQAVHVAELPARLPYHAPGETGYFTFAFQPLRDEQGQLTRISCVALDVTAQVRARLQVEQLNQQLAASVAELAQANAQLVRTNEDLDTFVYIASHDLKAPITNLEGLFGVLREELPAPVLAAPVTARVLRLTDDALARFRTTLDQLTDLSHLQPAQQQLSERVPLAPVVESVQLDLGPLLASTQAQVEVTIPAELAILFSPKNLRSVVANLLSNALKYRHPDRAPVVQLRATPAGERVVLTVQDNGLGMGGEQQRQLFGLFQRLHTHVEGTGVGLYLTKRLMENGGGTIAVESQLDIGTTFTLTFPA